MKCSDGNLKTEDIPSEDHSTELINSLKHNLYSLVSKKNSKNGFSLSLMGQKEHNNGHFSSANYSEIRCQSLPDCVEKLDMPTCNVNREDSDITYCSETPQNSTSESWFKTWPERCDKQRSTETSPVNSPLTTPTKNKNTQNKLNCDNFGHNNKNKVTLNEALKNISLAYSPVTKQLHLIEKSSNTYKENSDLESNKLKCSPKPNCEKTICNHISNKKSGHRRTEAGSFSSTISTISEPSSNGSLLSNDDRSLSSFEIPSSKTRKKSLTHFFSK